MKKVFFFLFVLVFSLDAHSQILETYMIEMRDGVKLATDVYLPSDFSDKIPALLIRTPYKKDDLKDIGNYISQTYTMAVVIQDMRGRFSSEGKFCFFRCDGGGDLQDGIDTIEWIRDQVWASGKIATYGGSALGITQYMLASTGVDLSAMVVEVATADLYGGIAFQNGCFRKADVEGWLNGINEGWVLDEIKTHTLYDSYWDVVDVTDNFNKVNVPTIHRGGWYDMFLQGTIDAYTGYKNLGGEGAKKYQKLIIGPWVHGGVPADSTKIGDLTFPANAKDIPQEWLSVILIWINHFLGLQPDPDYINSLPNVIYYTMGDVKDPKAPGNEWRTADDWPVPAANMRMYLHPSNRLSYDCPSVDDAYSQYRYDPQNPTPTIGGNNLGIANGPKAQNDVEQRGDVLVFTTDVLTEPVEITGRIKAHIFTSIDTKDTDIMVRLTDVYPDGKSYLIVDGAQRLASMKSRDKLEFVKTGEIVEAVIDLWSTSIIVNKGHRIRAIVSSANYPRFEKNLNDGSSYGENGTSTPVNVRIYHNPKYMSYIELPEPEKSNSDINYCIKSDDAGFDTSPSDTSYEDNIGIDTVLNDYTDISDNNLPDVTDASVPDAAIMDESNTDMGLTDLYTGLKQDSESSGCSCNLLTN